MSSSSTRWSITGLVTGTNRQTEGRGDRCWNQHIFANKETGEQNVVNFFCRIEYQDGKRKRVFRTKQDYHGRGTPHVHVLVWLRDMESIEIPIHLGMRLTFTRNINKEMDFVNGMSCVVLGVHKAGLRVRTDTNHIVCVYPWTDEWKTCFYPVRIGYAHTLMKMQGATLKDMTVWLDVANVEAAAYVALSRVEYDANWRFVGNPTVHHFTPATAV